MGELSKGEFYLVPFLQQATLAKKAIEKRHICSVHTMQVMIYTI